MDKRARERQTLALSFANGPHRAKDCPKREKLSALVAEGAKEVESDSESPTRVNPLQLLNAIHTESSRLVH